MRPAGRYHRHCNSDGLRGLEVAHSQAAEVSLNEELPVMRCVSARAAPGMSDTANGGTSLLARLELHHNQAHVLIAHISQTMIGVTAVIHHVARLLVKVHDLTALPAHLAVHVRK